ncbi:hypothetical protein ACP70R_024094 [Stipagrostis hirtigluma subsp. patula]
MACPPSSRSSFRGNEVLSNPAPRWPQLVPAVANVRRALRRHGLERRTPPRLLRRRVPAGHRLRRHAPAPRLPRAHLAGEPHRRAAPLGAARAARRRRRVTSTTASGRDEGVEIESHAVLGGGFSHQCVSAVGVGTYCFDAARGEWSRAGDWMLPFSGKAEYMPELNVWFGISSDEGCCTCASDLSPILNGEKPELCHVWKDLHPPPPEWDTIGTTQIVALGSGRLCVVDLLATFQEDTCGYGEDEVVDDVFAVFTGAEL